MNYFDFRKDPSIKGPGCLYGPNEETPLDNEEIAKVGKMGQSSKRRIKPMPLVSSLDEPVKYAPVSDTWTPQGFSYYGFLIGSRYNRSDMYDEVCYRDHGVLVPRNCSGKVFFYDRQDLDDELDDVRLSQMLDEATTLTSAVEDNEQSVGETPRGDGGQSSKTNITNSVASSAFYYKTNENRVKALLDRVAASMATARISSRSQYPTRIPRSILKGGGRKGQAFQFSSLNKTANVRFRGELAKKPNPRIDQLVSLGHQLATGNGGKSAY